MYTICIGICKYMYIYTVHIKLFYIITHTHTRIYGNTCIYINVYLSESFLRFPPVFISDSVSREHSFVLTAHTRLLLTVFRNNGESDNIAGFLDKLNNVAVRQLDDRLAVDRWDTIADMEEAAAVSGTAFDDSTNFVWYNWEGKCQVDWTKYLQCILLFFCLLRRKKRWLCRNNQISLYAKVWGFICNFIFKGFLITLLMNKKIWHNYFLKVLKRPEHSFTAEWLRFSHPWMEVYITPKSVL